MSAAIRLAQKVVSVWLDKKPEELWTLQLLF